MKQIMTKQQFIDEAKELGFKSTGDLVEKLGYHRRNLDRYTGDKQLTERFIIKFNEYKATLNESNTEEKAPTPKIEEPKVEVKKVEENTKPTPPKKVVEKKETKKEIKKEISTPKNTKNDTQIGIDITNDEYHSSTNLSTSKIKMIFDNPKEYYMKYVSREYKQKETEALVVGTIFHSLVLEPQKFDDEYMVLEISSRAVKNDLVSAVEQLGGTVETKENSKGEIVVADTMDTLKDKIELAKEKLKKKIITKAQLETAQKLTKQALASKLVMETINKATGEIETHFDFALGDILNHENCTVEKSFYGEINGEIVQIRVDILFNMSKGSNFYIAVDLKSAIDGTEKTFTSQLATHKYDIQDYIYTEVLRQNGIQLYEFRFCVAGKDEFSDAMFYSLGKDEKEDTAKVVDKIIDKYKYCRDNSLWKSTPFDYSRMRYDTTKKLEMPMWAKYKYIDAGVL